MLLRKGKPTPTLLEILNDPDIRVLSYDAVEKGVVIGRGGQG